MYKTEKEFLDKAHPLAQGLIDYAMEEGKKYGITDVSVSIGVNASQKNTIDHGHVSEVQSGLKSRIVITLYAGDRILTFAKNSMNEKMLRAAMLQNMQAIHVVPENHDGRLLEKEKVYKGPLIDLDLFDNNAPTQEEMIAYAKELESSALAQPAVKTTRSVSISKNNSHMLKMATNGIDIHKSETSYQAYAGVIAEDGNGMQTDGDYSVAKHFSDMARPQELGENAGQKARAKLGAIVPNTGEMPIVLSHAAAVNFFSAVYDAIDGSNVHGDATFMKGKIGQQVMSSEVTLVDNPLVARGLASSQVDSVGMESKEITFIENGVLKSYNVSLQEARQLGIEPIGRSGGTTNSYVKPGQVTPEELIRDIKEGIYIEDFSGGSVNVNNGTHSRQAHGVMIKDGKITDIAVDGFIVAGNLKEMFMKVALANDTPPLPNTKYSLAAPTTRINGVMIAGK